MPVETETMLSPEAMMADLDVFRETSGRMLADVPISCINTLAQHRNGRNARQADLDKSIAADEGQHHYQLDLTLLQEETLVEYIDFTNRVWGAEVDIADFTPVRPGLYVVMIAGHSRLESLKTYAKDKGKDESEVYAFSQIHQVDSIEDFMAIQLKENIHSEPPKDRAARAYAESFIYTKEKDKEITRAEFCRRHGISPGYLSEALLYADLPAEIRRLTDDGTLPFSISVELGKSMPWIKQDAEATAKVKKLKKAEFEEYVDEIVKDKLLHFIALYNGDRFNRHITNTKIFIRHQTQAIKDRLAEAEQSEDLEMALFDARQYESTPEELKAKVLGVLSELATKQHADITNLHNNICELLEEDGVEIDPEAEEMIREFAVLALESVRIKTEQDPVFAEFVPS